VIDHDDALARLRDLNPVTGIDPEELAGVVATCERRRREAPDAGPIRLVRGRRAWSWRPVVAFAAAFVVVIAALGLLALLGGADVPVVDEPTTTTAVTPTTAPDVLPDDPAPVGGSVNEVWDVAVAPDGNVWMATGGGVVMWDVATGIPRTYTVADGLPTSEVAEILVAPDGNVWAKGRGWIALFDGSWEALQAPQGVDGPAFGVAPDGTLWAVGGENDLYRFDGVDWQVIGGPGLEGVGEWSGSIAIGPDGTLWAATNMSKGLFSFDGTSWTNHADTGLPPGFALTVAVAPDGTVWASAEDDPNAPSSAEPQPGIVRFDGTSWTLFTTADGLYANLAEVTVGSDGTLWAIHDGAVSRFADGAWTAYEGVSGSGLAATVGPDGTLWMASPYGGVVGFDGESTTQFVVAVEEAPSEEPIAGPSPGSWDQILATTTAAPTRPIANCPVGTDVATPGPTGQARPRPGYIGNAAAAFDPTSGRVYYVDVMGETWTFDVCTNTWTAMAASGVVIDLFGGLVFDVDSNRVVALGDTVSIYDPTTNSWAQSRAAGAGGPLDDFWPVGGAVYDPVSGLVIVGHVYDVMAYDVDSDSWTFVGTKPQGLIGHLLGYSPDLDRLIFLSDTAPTVLLDPRSGDVTQLEMSPPQIVGGFGSISFTPGSDTAYAIGEDDEICAFDPVALDWDRCYPRRPGIRHPDAIVHDPINDRILWIGGTWGGWGEPEQRTDAVWSLDLETGEWTEVVVTSP